MRLRFPLALIVATAALAACDSPSSVADDVSIEIPAGFIGKGATVSVAVVNESDAALHAGSLPCVVRLEQLIDAKWEVVHQEAVCPGNVVEIAAGGRVEFNYLMPDEIGTYRLAVTLTHSAGGGSFVARTRKFLTAGIHIS